MTEARSQKQYRHFVVFPSADVSRGQACADKWIKKGYIALVQYDSDEMFSPCLSVGIDRPYHVLSKPKPFPGYYRAINDIVKYAFELGADLVTCIGDDMDPPDQGAQFVAQEFFKRFPDGIGVLQATGDRQGIDASGRAASERICGSPCFGREWVKRGYGSFGPFHAGYKSFYADEDLYEVTKRDNVLWQNPEMTIHHAHWSWGHAPIQPYHERAQENWMHDKALFETRREKGFPNK